MSGIHLKTRQKNRDTKNISATFVRISDHFFYMTSWISTILIGYNVSLTLQLTDTGHGRAAAEYNSDDFGIDYKTFYYIQRKLGFCTVDRFADDKNSK